MSDPVAELENELEALAEDRFCASARESAAALVSLLLPPENLSTEECAVEYRKLRGTEGEKARDYDMRRTPYMGGARGPMAAMDDPRYRGVIVVGPERSGKSVGGENHVFKRLRNGPLTDAIVYLQAKGDVDSYADKEFNDLIELHAEIRAKIPGWPKQSPDNKRNLKRIGGRIIQLLPANDGNLRQKEAALIVATEIDGWRKTVRNKAIQEIRGRQKAFGNQAKFYAESHPDIGMSGGIAAAWKESTRGLFYWPCTDCGLWSSPHPFARKGMRMKLEYERDDGLDEQARLEKVGRTARLSCPHCGAQLDDASRDKMVDAGVWVFQGELIDEDGTITGTPIEHDTAGFWIHGTMSKIVSLASLAKEYVSALIVFEKTRDPQRLKRAKVKSLGEAYDGAGKSGIFDAQSLKEAATALARAEGFQRGEVPVEVRYVTASVDVGKKKFDVMIVGWDLEGRAWIIDRFTIAQRMVGPNLVDIRPWERVEDWDVLRDQVLHRVLPLQSDPSLRMPVAAMTIDDGDGNATWKAREFARRMVRQGEFYGSAAKPWPKARLIKGRGGDKIEIVATKGRPVSVDDENRPVKPVLMEWDLGVDRLKAQTHEQIAMEEDGPGFVRFALGLPDSTFEEFYGEVEVNGKWERRGDNESLDLFGYAKGARIMLKPDRAGIDWDVRPPIWAQPVPIISSGTPAAPPAAPAPRKTLLERFDRLNAGD